MEEGYTILRSAKLVNNEYKLYKELVRPYHAFTESGRQELIHGASKLVKEDTPLKITTIPAVRTFFSVVAFLSSCSYSIPNQSDLNLAEMAMVY